MKAGRLVISAGVLLLLCLFFGAIFRLYWLQIRYHRYYLDRAAAEMLNPNGGSTRNLPLNDMLMTLPVVGGKFVKTEAFLRLEGHEQALVEFGYMERNQFPFQHAVLTRNTRVFYVELRQAVGTNYFWRCWPSSDGTSVTFTCPTPETKNWRKFLSEYDKGKK